MMMTCLGFTVVNIDFAFIKEVFALRKLLGRKTQRKQNMYESPVLPLTSERLHLRFRTYCWQINTVCAFKWTGQGITKAAS